MSVNTQQKPQEPQTPQLVPRKKIDHYSYALHDQIGKGFSSKVFKGKDDITQEIVAVKVITKLCELSYKVIDMKLITNSVESALIKQEINALKIMVSPNILKMHDFYQTNNNTYIITEFCNQGDLGNILKKCGRIPEQEATKIMKHLFNGFKEQIKHEIVHRDLKPQNIFLKNGIPKIADYGFSKLLHTKEKIYYNVGTPYYMSPQTILQNKCSEKSDLWSLGVLFYEILYGQVPWSGSCEKELAQNMINILPTFDPSVPVSEEAKDFISKLLIVDEDQRISVKDIDSHPLFRRRNTIGAVQKIKGGLNYVNRSLSNNRQQIPLNNLNEAHSFTKMDGTGSTDYIRGQMEREKQDQYANDTLKYVNGPAVISLQAQVNYPNQRTGHQPKKQSITSFQEQIHLTQQPNSNINSTKNSYLTNNLADPQFNQNNEIIKAELYFIKFLQRTYKIVEYYNFFTTPNYKEKLQFFLLKNSLIRIQKLINMTNFRTNSFLLQNFDQYIISVDFLKFAKEIKDYFEDSTQQYQELWNRIQGNIGMQDALLKDIPFDQNFDEVLKFYHYLSMNLKNFAQEVNYNLSLKLSNYPDQYELPQELKAGTILLDYLIVYHRLVTLIMSHFEDPTAFSRYSQIKDKVEDKPGKYLKVHYLQIKNNMQQSGL